MMWYYKKTGFTNEMIPEGAVGFIYMMQVEVDGKMMKYVGKKSFYSSRKVKKGKKELANMADKRLKKYNEVVKPSYQDYYSSNEVIKNAHKGGVYVRRDILDICYSKTEMTYKEAKYQFSLGVLESTEYLNGNILGKFYKGRI